MTPAPTYALCPRQPPRMMCPESTTFPSFNTVTVRPSNLKSVSTELIAKNESRPITEVLKNGQAVNARVFINDNAVS